MFNKENIKSVLKLALPAVGEMILYMMIWIFDTMMVGNYGGKVAVSTVGLSSELIYTVTNIFIAVGVTVGITSLVARCHGAKENKIGREYAATGFYIGFIIALTISLSFFFFSENMLTLAGAEIDVIYYGNIYMKIVSIGIFFNMLMSLLNGYLRGIGNTKTPLFASLLINIINITLDYVLIFGKLSFPSLGIKGAAIATAIAHISGFIFILIYTNKKTKLSLNPFTIWGRREKFNRILKLSIPSSMQEGVFSVARLLCTILIMSLGTIAFASNQITTTIESISFMPGWGFAIAATTLVGHKIGEGDFKKAKEYGLVSVVLGASLMTLCGIVFLIFSENLVSLFIGNSDIEVIRLGSKCLKIAAIEQPFIAISMILGGALKGKGDTKTPFVISLITSWFIRIPLMLYFIYILKLSIEYVWMITAFAWFIDSALILYSYNKRFHKFTIL